MLNLKLRHSNVHDINVISNECANVNNEKDNHGLINS